MEQGLDGHAESPLALHPLRLPVSGRAPVLAAAGHRTARRAHAQGSRGARRSFLPPGYGEEDEERGEPGGIAGAGGPGEAAGEGDDLPRLRLGPDQGSLGPILALLGGDDLPALQDEEHVHDHVLGVGGGLPPPRPLSPHRWLSLCPFAPPMSFPLLSAHYHMPPSPSGSWLSTPCRPPFLPPALQLARAPHAGPGAAVSSAC